MFSGGTDFIRGEIFRFEENREFLLVIQMERGGIEQLLAGAEFTFAIGK